ncbi:ATP-grasp domain-containing protein [Streptomyces sp. BH-SS-21]|uniref:ATP-grasp domain-containing protein n=1 Tax=Streptomyces liliiviolaceus TaxID=2823109 RepID=A0A940Y574_9ACTN|nr:ATP-grasp domain-containing protein [Streptomyces liliiviolaceus]MBQ0855455.1 ATP-grasp domain-containing protein [Streptomyces liliiviolaceus]
MSARPLVLVVSPGDEAYRGYCLEQVATAYDIVLLTGTEPSWEKVHIVDHAVVDLHDTDALLAAGQALADRHDLAGVLTWDEWLLLPTARLARALGLPSHTVQAARACRDKATARTLFARHQVPSAASTRVRTLEEAQAAASWIGYPVVLKPAAHAGAVGVLRVDTPAQLAAAYRAAHQTAKPTAENNAVLVEEFLDGPEISVECVTYRSVTTVIAVNRKTISEPPHFEQLAHCVDANDPLLDTVAPTARAAIQALGITDGISHVEIRLVDDQPRLVEVNGRLAGDMIGHLVHLATGIDLPRAAADLACGRAPNLTPTRFQTAAIRLIYPMASGTLTRLRHTGPRRPWLDRLHFQRRPGHRLLLPQDGGNLFTARAGFFIVTGRSTPEVTQRLDTVADEITLTMQADR